MSNLSTVAIEEAKPYVHESKATGLKQEVLQEEGNAPVGPAAVDQQQPLQEPKLGQSEVCVLHGLTSLHSCYSHTNVSRWQGGEGEGGRERRRRTCKSRQLNQISLVLLNLTHS